MEIVAIGLASVSSKVTVCKAGCGVIGTCILQVFDALGYAGFLLDQSRQVLAHNAMALSCLSDGLTITRKCVEAADRRSNSRLQSLISSALEPSGPPSRSSAVGVRRHEKLPLVVHVLRLGEDAQLDTNIANLLLVACDPEFSRLPPQDMLTDIFGLTATEASVATAIATGRSLTEIAMARGVKVDTARAHSKAVFAKTNTRGQAELAGLLNRLAGLSSYGKATFEHLNG